MINCETFINRYKWRRGFSTSNNAQNKFSLTTGINYKLATCFERPVISLDGNPRGLTSSIPVGHALNCLPSPRDLCLISLTSFNIYKIKSSLGKEVTTVTPPRRHNCPHKADRFSDRVNRNRRDIASKCNYRSFTRGGISCYYSVELWDLMRTPNGLKW